MTFLTPIDAGGVMHFGGVAHRWEIISDLLVPVTVLLGDSIHMWLSSPLHLVRFCCYSHRAEWEAML
jgi:hypothetical protein